MTVKSRSWMPLGQVSWVRHTDFILAVIGEELGVAGICVLLALYGMIGYAGLRTAKAAKGAYAKLLAAGLTSLILCQALLNIYTVLGLAPARRIRCRSSRRARAR